MFEGLDFAPIIGSEQVEISLEDKTLAFINFLAGWILGFGIAALPIVAAIIAVGGSIKHTFRG